MPIISCISGPRAERWPVLFTNSEDQSFCLVADDGCVFLSRLFPICKIMWKEPYFVLVLWLAFPEHRPAGKQPCGVKLLRSDIFKHQTKNLVYFSTYVLLGVQNRDRIKKTHKTPHTPVLGIVVRKKRARN